MSYGDTLDAKAPNPTMWIESEGKNFWFNKNKLHNALFAASILLISPNIVEYLIVELRSMQYTTATFTSRFVSYISSSSCRRSIGNWIEDLEPYLLPIAFNNDLGTFSNLRSCDGSCFFVESRFIKPLPLKVVS